MKVCVGVCVCVLAFMFICMPVRVCLNTYIVI